MGFASPHCPPHGIESSAGRAEFQRERPRTLSKRLSVSARAARKAVNLSLQYLPAAHKINRAAAPRRGTPLWELPGITPLSPDRKQVSRMKDNRSALILAAGEGKRMHSDKAKVLSEVLFKPMIAWVVDAAAAAGIEDICAVVGHGAGEVTAELDRRYGGGPPRVSTALQRERLGTGHAVLSARSFLEARGGDVLVLCGDAPFISPDQIREAYDFHSAGGYAATVISAKLKNPAGYGRIVRLLDGSFTIIEQNDASPDQLQIDEVNSGAYWLSAAMLLDLLPKLSNQNAKGEYYLTDIFPLMKAEGYKFAALAARDTDAILGANDRRALLRLNDVARLRVLDRLLDSGVEIICSDGIVISPDAEIGGGTAILPGTLIKGDVKIGRQCVIGPNTSLECCTVGDGTVINACQCAGSRIGSGVRLGPWLQLGPRAVVKDGAEIGGPVG